MENEILNSSKLTKDDLELRAILVFLLTGYINNNMGIKLPQNINLADVINKKEGLKQHLEDILMHSEFDNELLKKCCIDKIREIIISDGNLQNIIAQIQRTDLKNRPSEYIDIILEKYFQNNKDITEVSEPSSLKHIITCILQIKEGDIYDGTCGIGNLLIEANNAAEKENVNLYGQEINLSIWMLAQIKLRMHGYKNFNIEYGDTIKDPRFKNGLGLKKFDYVIMNIPFGMKNDIYEDIKEDVYGRYKYGIPPKHNLDYAFIQQGTASLKEKGKAAIVVPRGVLFREAIERKIRINMLKDDVIEGIISLPPMFANTAISTAIMIFNKDKKSNMKKKVFFIKADELGKKGKRATTLSQEDINRIINAYLDKREEENFSKIVYLDEIQENNYNLDTSKYIKDYKVVTEEGILNLDINKFESNSNTMKLKDIAKLDRGMNLPKLNGNIITNYKAITLSDVQDGELIIDKLTDIELNDLKRIQKYRVDRGDILLSCRGNTVKIAVVEDIPGNIIVSNNFIKITTNYNVNPYFVKAYMESPLGQYYITSKQTGTTIKVLSVSDLYDMPIPMISVEAQNKVAQKYLESQHEYKEGLKKIEKKLKEDTFRVYEMIGINEIMN